MGNSMYHGVQSASQLKEVEVLHCALWADPRARAISFSKLGSRPTLSHYFPALPYSFGTTLHRSEQNLKCFCSLLNKHLFFFLINISFIETSPNLSYHCPNMRTGTRSRRLCVIPIGGSMNEFCSVVPQGFRRQSPLSHRHGDLLTGGLRTVRMGSHLLLFSKALGGDRS